MCPHMYATHILNREGAVEDSGNDDGEHESSIRNESADEELQQRRNEEKEAEAHHEGVARGMRCCPHREGGGGQGI